MANKKETTTKSNNPEKDKMENASVATKKHKIGDVLHFKNKTKFPSIMKDIVIKPEDGFVITNTSLPAVEIEFSFVDDETGVVAQKRVSFSRYFLHEFFK